MEEAVKKSIERLGDTRLKLSSLEIRNPEGLFVPVSTLNRLRRDLTAELEKRVVELRNRRTEAIKGEVVMPPVRPARSTDFLWSVKTDRVSNLSAFDAESLAGLEEIVVDVQREGVEEIGRELDRLCAAVGRERIRLALPAITRAWEVPALRAKIEHFMSAGWKNWEAANLSAWPFLGVEPSGERERDLSLACDWSIYVTNRQAALQALSMGASRFTLSPEDGIENMRRLLAEFAERAAVIVYQDTPLFISESCAYANLAGKCPGRAECPFEAIELVSAFGDRVTALQERCRTALVAREPFSISGRLNDLAEAGARRLRVDFVWRRYEPRKALEVYRAARAGRAIEGTRIANFERGMI
jgi:putative protease